ncbi:MAG: STAS domain-containing protein [Synergistales bacterium]|nr:STAS domain-containing protein [Synergistales bacterium]
MSLEITKSVEGTSLILTLNGRLDTITSQEFDKEFAASVLGVKEVTLDFAGLEYISSAGLRSLLKAKRSFGDGPIKIIHANEVIKNVFAISHFSDHIPIEG